MTAAIGHNALSFDEVVEENLRRGLYLAQRDALINVIRDPRCELRHHVVIAEIIAAMNDRSGMAFPGRQYLAERTGYTVRTIDQTIFQLVQFGYVMSDRRAPASGRRALAHYTITKASVEDLHAEIEAYIEEQRRRNSKRLEKRGAPWAKSDFKGALEVSKPTDFNSALEPSGVDFNPALEVTHGADFKKNGADFKGPLGTVNKDITLPSLEGDASHGVADATPPRSKKGSRLPEDWTLPEAERCYARKRGLSERQIDAVAKKFRNYWLAESGKHAVKLRWDLTWQNWVDKQIDEFGLKPEGSSDPGSSDLDGKVAAVLNSDVGRHMVGEYGLVGAREKIRDSLVSEGAQHV